TDGRVTEEFSSINTSRIAAELRRINLNRGLLSPGDKVQMAQEIFDRLVRVTGALPPSDNPPFTNRDVNDRRFPQYRATRWLAQFAVNIVDFIDSDSDMTMFLWNPYFRGSKNYK